MSLYDRDDRGMPSSFDQDMYDQPDAPEWTDADLRADALAAVRRAMVHLDIAAERLTDLVQRVDGSEADTVEGYACCIDEAREAIRAAGRWMR